MSTRLRSCTEGLLEVVGSGMVLEPSPVGHSFTSEFDGGGVRFDDGKSTERGR